MPANSKSWTNVPLARGVPIPYKARFDGWQFSRLIVGLTPKQMEDKWFIYYEEPHLRLHRSWSGHAVYRVTLKIVLDGAEVTEALLSQDLAETSKWGLDYSARLLDFLISNLLLGQRKPFPVPPDVPEPVQKILQHHISGTGYPSE